MTCDFAEEIRERDVKGKRKAKAKAIDQSFRLRLHSGLRQSGTQSSRKMPRDDWGTRHNEQTKPAQRQVIHLKGKVENIEG